MNDINDENLDVDEKIESKADRDKLYEEAINTQSNTVKINFLLRRQRAIEDRLDNGISEKVFRNSWAIGIYGMILGGMLAAIFSGIL